MRLRPTALFTAAALALCLCLGAAAAAPTYADTGGLAPWAADAVAYVTERGLMNGVGAGRFDPDGHTDRAMVATITWRLAGCPIGNITGVFDDVPLGEWYSDAIDWAAEEGVVTGAGGSFLPFDTILRQDLVVILYRYAGSPASDVAVLSYFNDFTQVSGYAANAMAWAVENGVITGSGGSLLPRDGATRAQLAAVLMRYLELEDGPGVTDPDPGETDPGTPDPDPGETDPGPGETDPDPGETGTPDPGEGIGLETDELVEPDEGTGTDGSQEPDASQEPDGSQQPDGTGPETGSGEGEGA